MKLHLVTTLARQIGGDHVFCLLNKAFADKTLAEQFCRNITTKLDVEDIPCTSERSVMEVETDEPGDQLFVALCLARQVDGEYVFVKIDKVSPNKSVVEEHYRNLPVQEAVMIDGVQCVAERNILTVDCS